MAYERRYRERVLKYLSEGHTVKQATEQYGVGSTTIGEWKRRQKTGEGLEVRTRIRKPRKVVPEKLQAYIAANPDAYLSEIANISNVLQRPCALR